MGIKEDYQQAVDLVQQDRYIEARRLLIAHDHPKTNALLDKVNKAILANGISQHESKNRDTSSKSSAEKIFRAIVVSFFLVCGGFVLLCGGFVLLCGGTVALSEFFSSPSGGETTNLSSNINADTDTDIIVSTQAPSTNLETIDNLIINPLNPQTVYAAIGARTSDCPSIDCNPIQVYQSEELTLLGVAQGGLLEGSTVLYQVSRNGEIFFIHEYSITFRGPTPVVPTVDWRVEEQPVYYGNNNSSSSGNTNNNTSSSGNTRRPENCDDARAMRLTAQEAAQWDHLDADNDGVACYGD